MEEILCLPKFMFTQEVVVWSKALLVIYESNRGESRLLTTPETGQKLRFSGVFNTDNVFNVDKKEKKEVIKVTALL